MMRVLSLILAVYVLAVPVAQAQSPVLIELFASKNCRACPKAHRTLKTVDAERDDVLILTWSVDYWDYLGGKDPMAMHESAERQRGYVDRFGLRGPYTPQTVYNGLEQCPGNKPKQVDTALEKVYERELPMKVTLASTADGVILDGETGDLTDIWFVDYLDGDDNTTDMVHPVTNVASLGPWLGGRTQLTLPECHSHCALIVQEAGFGPVLSVLPLDR